IAKKAIDYPDLETLLAADVGDNKTVKDLITENVATIGENLTLRRMKTLQVSSGVIASYDHNSVTTGLSKISALVALELTGDKAKLMELGKGIAMHIAASRPECLDKESVDPALIEREKLIFTEQSRASGKPDNIIEKMIDGRIRKFLEEIVLLDQVFALD